MKTQTRTKLESLLASIQLKYGEPASSHESLGVIIEEYDELLLAIRRNNPVEVANEAIDLAAACIRLADACADEGTAFAKRSGF